MSTMELCHVMNYGSVNCGTVCRLHLNCVLCNRNVLSQKHRIVQHCTFRTQLSLFIHCIQLCNKTIRIFPLNNVLLRAPFHHGRYSVYVHVLLQTYSVETSIQWNIQPSIHTPLKLHQILTQYSCRLKIDHNCKSDKFIELQQLPILRQS